jgi:phospholipid-binding lipoprotein MlaA
MSGDSGLVKSEGTRLKAIKKAAVCARLIRAWALTCLVTGCATSPGANPQDPWEAYNRSMFGFNEGFDRAFLKPVATVYKAVTPQVVRTGVGNFFANLTEPWVAVNAALQMKGLAATESMVRFGINTVLGLGGILDIATEADIERRNEDFGQTLGYWGVEAGPYVVLPFFGPATVRDGGALLVDMRGDPVLRETNLTTRDTASALRLVDFRASFLRATEILENAALDKYSFTRDVYLQRRQALILDGQESPEPSEANGK